jgi:hypothetical protein
MSTPELETRLAHLPRPKRTATNALLAALVELLGQGTVTVDQIREATDHLTVEHDEAGHRLLEVRNDLLGLTRWQRIGAGCLAPERLPKRSRERYRQLRQLHRLIGLRVPGTAGFSYPAWQFDDDLQPLPHVPELAAIQDEADLSAAELHELMTNADVGAGIEPAELLRTGDMTTLRRILLAQADQAA